MNLKFPSNNKYVALAPGRVNLLGEHVDYNEGLVLPAAIDRKVKLSFQLIDEPVIHLQALDLNQTVSISIKHLDDQCDTDGHPLPAFARYPAAVAWALQQAGLEVRGVQAEYTSTVPIAAGLSSSAAVEVAFAISWQALGGWTIPRMQLAELCQFAENEYVGVQSGLMDQFASLFGVESHVLYFDTRSLDWEPIALPKDTVIIIADSKIRRTLAGSVYNERRRACQQALDILKSHLPQIKALRDVHPDDFNQYAHYLPPVARKRAQHVVEECKRVELASNYLKQSNTLAFGQLMFDCHKSLRDLYEVSCPELDSLVEIARQQPGCLGARLTGAGFGGCTVNLVKEEYVNDFITRLSGEYTAKTGKYAQIYPCYAAAGAAVECSDPL
ncbi:MAG: galactokinase [Chloroflexota bacterium]